MPAYFVSRALERSAPVGAWCPGRREPWSRSFVTTRCRYGSSTTRTGSQSGSLAGSTGAPRRPAGPTGRYGAASPEPSRPYAALSTQLRGQGRRLNRPVASGLAAVWPHALRCSEARPSPCGDRPGTVSLIKAISSGRSVPMRSELKPGPHSRSADARCGRTRKSAPLFCGDCRPQDPLSCGRQSKYSGRSCHKVD